MVLNNNSELAHINMTQRTNSNFKYENLEEYADEDPLEETRIERAEESDTELANEETNPLQLFLHTYAVLPELWNPEHAWYQNKSKRHLAYKRLLEIYRRSKPNANIECVKKKINSLRSNYRKELKKIAESQLIANTPEEMYKPKSWVFYELQFLDIVQEQKAQETVTDNYDTSLNAIFSDEDYTDPQIEVVKRKHSTSPSPSIATGDEQRQAVSKHLFNKKRKLATIVNRSYRHHNQSLVLTDKTPTIAKAWGEKLLELEPQQRNFAEKAINDVLFEASQGTLHRHSVRINDNS